MKKKRIVIALGHDALGETLPQQKTAVGRTAKIIADLVELDYQIIITHSNAPQVGMIHVAMSELSRNHSEYTAAPMSVCSAMSQGYIGYDLQNAIRTELVLRGTYKPVCTVLTQVSVDPYDEAFYHPSKIIGRTMDEEDAEREEKKGNSVVETDGGYRRIVAAPKPIDIIEIDSIRALADADHVVIACGGGGIPVLVQNHILKGAGAVIEKDLAAGLLAEKTDADILMILTYDEKLSLRHYADDSARLLDTISVAEAQRYIEEKQFGAGTKQPKVQAAVSFIGDSTEKMAIITNLSSCIDALEGKTGTIIRNPAS